VCAASPKLFHTRRASSAHNDKNTCRPQDKLIKNDFY
jgi:hypothetical protein